MSYKYSVIKDNPIAFWFLDEQSGVDVLDSSGCGNTGTYSTEPASHPLPLTYGGVSSVEINSTQQLDLPLDFNYYGVNNGIPIANKYSSDNDFTLECWIYPKSLSSTFEPLVADVSNDIGIFVNNNGICFCLGDLENVEKRIDYSILNFDRAVHVVCMYSVNYISVYIDGELVAQKSISGFVFDNTSLALQAGPASSSNKFLIDAIAVYRYSLSPDKIKTHFISSQSRLPFEVYYPEEGEAFEIYDNNISTKFSYSYPANKPWGYFTNTGLQYNVLNNSLEIRPGSGDPQTIEVEDFLFIPAGYGIDNSKIEWNATLGVSVLYSVDGESYYNCENGSAIPAYMNEESGDSFDPSNLLYLKIVLDTDDDSIYIPSISSLTIKFYKGQKLYSTNSTSYLSQMMLDPTYPSRAYLGETKYPPLSRNIRNGITSKENSGFLLNLERLSKSIEFFYTPKTLEASSLFYRPLTEMIEINGGLYSSTYGPEDVVNGGLYNSVFTDNYDAGMVVPDYPVAYSWDSYGDISTENIDSIYVNGVEKTNETDISNVFKESELHHVIVNLTDPVYNSVKMNYSAEGSNESIYQYISLYEDNIEPANATKHYNLYVNGDPILVSEPSMSITENSVSAYDYDWLVIQNV